MSHPSRLVPATVGMLCMAASAQSTLTPSQITAPIRDAGTYHVATGTWTRSGPSTAFNTDVLFNHTASTGYYFATTAGMTTIDHGRLPSTSSPIIQDSVAGTADVYTIDCFQIGYCSGISGAIGDVDIALDFYDDYTPCTCVGPVGGPAAIASFIATGLPGAGSSASQGCWVIAFDLANTTATFVLEGDADGTWDNQVNSDSFGWGLTFTNATVSNGTGPFIAGNCPVFGVTTPQKGYGTIFGGIPGRTDSTGLGTEDFFWIDTNGPGTCATSNGGCFFFGGCTIPGIVPGPLNPFGGFWLQLFGKEGGPTAVGTAYCSSLINSTGSAAILSASASDTNADLVLTSEPVPDTTGQFFFGPTMLLGTQSLGDGLRCVGGMTERLLPFISAGMMMQASNSASFTVNYTAPYAAGLTGIKHFQHWFREPSGTSATGSNTSTSISIAF